MNNLQQYFEDRKQFVELLEAVGISTLQEFAEVNPSTVLPELHQAKRMLKLEAEIPVALVFTEWVAQALTAPKAANPENIVPFSSAMLPLAMPVDAQENAVKTSAEASSSKEKGASPAKAPIKSVTPKARLQEGCSYRPAKPAPAQDQPKTYLRKKGIKHLTPFRTWFGALAVLFLFATTISAVVLTAMMLLNGERGWLIISLCFGPWVLALILYLALALPRKCSVCRASTLSFKKYNRNKAAHHIPLLGYVFATALHIFLFNWFRCPACGSAQQLGGKSSDGHGRG